MSFVHLHTHTEYSLLDGAARVKDLVARAKAYEMPALAITDHGYMYGAVDFYRQASEAGVKPIIGCEVYFTPQRTLSGGKPELYHLLLLAKNNEGYRNLMALVSEAAVEGYYYKPQVDLELLERYSAGLIGTSACMSGVVSKSLELGNPAEARRWAETYARTFAPGDFYLEIQDQGITGDNGVTQAQLASEIASLAGELGLGIVGTNDIHYLERDDAKTQDILLCIGTGKTLDEENRMRFSCDQFYMKSAEEMSGALSGYPEALSNTLEIAERCSVDIEFGKIILPKFEVPGGGPEVAYLRDQCIEGLKARYGDPVPEQVMERLDYEVSIVGPKGIAAYFLIVADFTKWARDNGVHVGPGRGSGAGSIIAYSLGITNLDPLEQGLLFERFLNPDRTEMPDIDMDFDDEGRGRVIDYVREKYGAEKVCQIVTFGTLKSRAAVKDAGRVLGYPYGVPDKLCKMFPPPPSDVTISLALFGDKDEGIQPIPDLKVEYETNPDSKRILDAAMAIEGITRNEGVHAAGVVICPDPLSMHLPVKKDTKGGSTVTQFDGPTVGALGLLKMDFLGLKTLSRIAGAVRNIEANHGVHIDVDTIPRDDPDTFKLLQQADTDGVFQVESAGMKRVLTQLKPTSFADIVAVVALFRPGPMDSIPEYIARKHGRSRIVYYDDRLKPILEETYGMLVYQEQVMRISMLMSGFSGGKADKLRKGMSKKKAEILDALEPEFMEGAVANGYERRMVEGMWRDILEFGKYAFNKSHAAAYAIVAYQTAYLKAHYPLEYMAAVLTSYTGKTDEIVKYIVACNRGGITVLPPDVNSSRKDFTPVSGEGVRFGLAGIRGVGEGVVEMIVAIRDEGGPFASLHDFCDRVDLDMLNRKTLEALIKAGAFDSTGYTRKHLMSIMDEVVDAASKRHRDRKSGQVSMFEMFADADAGFAQEVPPPNGDEWDKKMKLAFEKEMLGIYVSDHPLKEIEGAIRRAADCSLGELEELRDGTVCWFAGILGSVERRTNKRGQMYAVSTLEDLEGSVEVMLFANAFDKFREILVEDSIVRVKGRYEGSDRAKKILVSDVQLFSAGDFAAPPGVVIVQTDAEAFKNGRVTRLKEIMARYPGQDALEVHLNGSESVQVWSIGTVDRNSNGLHAELMELFGGGSVR